MTCLDVKKFDKISYDLAKLASRAVLYEVSAFPKLGLVTPITTGAHHDMDFFTFIDSTTALHEYFIKFAQTGFKTDLPKDVFKNLRQLGIEAESAMFNATNGVNTHKGMIFLMATCLGATASALKNRQSFDDVPVIIKAMTKGLVLDDLTSLTEDLAKTHGEVLFFKYGVTGIRGEVEKGLPTVFNESLPFYLSLKNVDINTKLVLTLLKIMSVCDDTTILHRKGIKSLHDVKKFASTALEMANTELPNLMDFLNQEEKNFIKQRISPGGAADLLAITTFFAFVSEQFFKVDEKREPTYE